MLDEQILKIADCLNTVVSEIEDVKKQSEEKSKAAQALNNEVQDYLHLLEADENISDETAGKYGKLIAEKRRKRRDFDTYVKAVNPLIVFLAKNGNAWDELKLAVSQINEFKENTSRSVYAPRSDKMPGGNMQIGNVQIAGTVDDSPLKPPCKILATTAGGLKILFNSIAQTSRAFLYSSSEIVNCAKGYVDNIDGDQFSFATERITDPNVRLYYEAKSALLTELSIREQRKKYERHQKELIEAATGQTNQKNSIEKFKERLAKTEEMKRPPEPEKQAEPEEQPLRKRNAKPVRGTADDGTIVEFPSVSAAGKALGCDITLVGKAIKGNYRAKGYRWEYI